MCLNRDRHQFPWQYESYQLGEEDAGQLEIRRLWLEKNTIQQERMLMVP
jgi:hypothetical protein